MPLLALVMKSPPLFGRAAPEDERVVSEAFKQFVMVLDLIVTNSFADVGRTWKSTAGKHTESTERASDDARVHPEEI